MAFVFPEPLPARFQAVHPSSVQSLFRLPIDRMPLPRNSNIPGTQSRLSRYSKALFSSRRCHAPFGEVPVKSLQLSLAWRNIPVGSKAAGWIMKEAARAGTGLPASCRTLPRLKDDLVFYFLDLLVLTPLLILPTIDRPSLRITVPLGRWAICLHWSTQVQPKA